MNAVHRQPLFALVVLTAWNLVGCAPQTNDDRIQAMAREQAAAIEAVTGATFEGGLPPILVVEPTDMRRALRLLAPTIAITGATELVARRTMAKAVDLAVDRLGGLYVPTMRAIFIRREQRPPPRGVPRDDALRYLITHELVHALDHWRHPSLLQNPSNVERQRVLSTMVEGHAEWVSRLALAHQGRNEVHNAMRLARLSRASKQPDGWLMIATYEEGLQFFLTLEAHGIDPEKVLDSPPVSMSQLLHPGKLFEQVEPTLELASLWDTLRSMLGEGRAGTDRDLDEATFRDEWAPYLSEDELEELADGFRGAAHQVTAARLFQRPEFVTLSVQRFRTPELASRAERLRSELDEVCASSPKTASAMSTTARSWWRGGASPSVWPGTVGRRSKIKGPTFVHQRSSVATS